MLQLLVTLSQIHPLSPFLSRAGPACIPHLQIALSNDPLLLPSWPSCLSWTPMEILGNGLNTVLSACSPLWILPWVPSLKHLSLSLQVSELPSVSTQLQYSLSSNRVLLCFRVPAPPAFTTSYNLLSAGVSSCVFMCLTRFPQI